MGFDPDKYLAESSGFDPDAYLAEKPSVAASALRKGQQGLTGGLYDELAGVTESIGRAVGVRGAGGPAKDITTLEGGPSLDIIENYKAGRDAERERLALDQKTNPIASTTAEIGGALVSPLNKLVKGAGLVGGGATLGGIYGAGYSEADSFGGLVADTAMGAGTGALVGKGVDKLSKAIAPASQSVAKAISPALEKKNTQEIIAAAKELGIKVTPGMLDDTGFIQRLEYTLANSPGLLGQRVNRTQKAVIDKIDDAVTTQGQGATSLSPYQVGERFKSGLTAKVGERLDPIASTFDEVAEITKNIPVSGRSKEAIIRNIEKIPEVRLSGGKGKPGEYLDMIRRIDNADDAKRVMTLINKDIAATQGSDRLMLMAIKDKVGTLEKNSTMRSAIALAKEGGMRKATGEKIGREIVGDLMDARKGYRDLATDLTKIAENNRTKFGGPSSFLDAVESQPSEKIQQKFFNTDNLRQIQNLKDKFPEQFDLLKSGKIQEIVQYAQKPITQGEGVSAVKFIKEVNNLNPEIQQMLFGEGMKTIKNAETILRAMPKNFNPSGSGTQTGWQDAAYQTVKDVPNYLLYKGASTNLGQKIRTNINVPEIGAIQKKAAGAIVNGANPAIVGAGAGVRGVQKWIADGQNKVQEADSSIDKEFLEKFRDSKSGRAVMIRASELEPSSQQMQRVLEQIKTSEEYKKHLKQKEKSAQGKEPDQSSVKPQMKFPQVLQKDGFTAVVRNMNELDEARSEGWA